MKYPKGVSGNPRGRKKGSFDLLPVLMKAVRKVDKTEAKELLVHFVERAFVNDAVLIALMKKILPDKKEVSSDPENPIDPPVFLNIDLNKAGNDELVEFLRAKIARKG